MRLHCGKRWSRSCLTAEAEPWKVHVRLPTGYTETGTTALRRIPMIDPQPDTPSRLTFEAQDTMTNVAEPTVIDHGSHNVNVPVQRCPGEVVARASAGMLEETNTAGCGAKGPETTGESSGGATEGRCRDAKGEGRTGWEWETTENGLGRETPVGSEG